MEEVARVVDITGGLAPALKPGDIVMRIILATSASLR